jgi:hypothetical protein
VVSEDEWDKGRWCDICHQRHHQIHPPCLEERRRRERAKADPDALDRLIDQLILDLLAKAGGRERGTW